eukprot:g2917.t1
MSNQVIRIPVHAFVTWYISIYYDGGVVLFVVVLMRQLGMKDMREKFKSVFEFCPPKILNGAIQTLANLCEEHDSPALPKMDIRPIIFPRMAIVKEEKAGSNKSGMNKRKKKKKNILNKNKGKSISGSCETLSKTPLHVASVFHTYKKEEKDGDIGDGGNENEEQHLLPKVIHVNAMDWNFNSSEGEHSYEEKGGTRNKLNEKMIMDESSHTRSVSSAPLRSGITGGVSSISEELKNKSHKISIRANRPTTAENDLYCGVGIFRRLFDSVRMPRTQNQEDRRRQKGLKHRMGLPPEVPFDLLVLDPYGSGVEVLTCTHVRNDSHGFQRLRVTHKKDLQVPYRTFRERDVIRQMEFNALMAERKVKMAQKRNAINRRRKLQVGFDKQKYKLSTYGLTQNVKQLDLWVNEKESTTKCKLKKLKRKQFEKKSFHDKNDSSDDESHVHISKMTWENIDL